MVELVVRLVFSLAVVLGMVLVLAKLSAKRFRGSSEALVRVVHRQPLSRGSAVSVVTIGSRVLVLGTTEQRVELLTELDPEDLDLDTGELAAASDPGLTTGPATGPAFAPALDAALRQDAQQQDAPQDAARLGARPRPSGATRRAQARTAGRHARTDSALAGSVLSPQTWRQAFAAVSGKAQSAS